MILSREDLLKKRKVNVQKIELSKDESVYIKEMNGKERDAFEQSSFITTKDAKGNTSYETNMDKLRARLACYCLCDKDGNRLLQDNDIDMLNENMSAAYLTKIMTEAQKLNKMTEQDAEAIVKN